MNLLRPSVGFYSPIAFDPIIATQNDFRFLNTDDLLRLAIRLAFVRFDNFPPIDVDVTMFKVKNFTAIELLDREFSIRRKKISDLLILSINSELNASGNIRDSEVEILFDSIGSLPALRKIVREAISPLLLSDDYALCGKNLLLDLPNSYMVASDNEELQNLLTRVIRKRNLFQKIKNEQETLSIQRKNFRWITNPFLVPIRQLYADRIKEMVALHRYVFGEFDLSIQLLMHLGAYEVEEVWSIPEELMSLQSLRSVEAETCVKFERMVNEGRIVPNDSLVLQEITRLADELGVYFSGLHINVDGANISLPSSHMCSMNFSPFADIGAHTEIVLTDKEFIDSPNGKIMIAHERVSGKKVIFSPLSSEVSALYSRGFCNLHYANPGEIAVYGAFVEGENLPFAYSSYGRISYNYTKEMLAYLGFADGEIIESSRAWNTAWAPENTMSVLFLILRIGSRKLLGMEFAGFSPRSILISDFPQAHFAAFTSR